MGRSADIKVGTLCNNNCRFCAQAMYRMYNKTTQEVIEDLEAAKNDGCDRVIFTGGEPTIRKDILNLVRYAKRLGFDVIQIQTNGRMFYYKKFCEQMIEAGANEFALALHGPTPEVHDFLTRAPGSFKQTVMGIKNLKSLGQKVIMNSVVTKPNYRFTPDTARLFVALKVDQFQFAFVHATGNAKVYFDSMMPRMSLAVPYLKKALQIGIDAGIPVMVEAVPFCLLKGYEKYVSDLYIPPSEVREYEHFFPKFEETRKQIKRKFPQCKQCKYDLICEGPWMEYPDRFGSDEFKPVPGRKIKSVEELFEEYENEKGRW